MEIRGKVYFKPASDAGVSSRGPWKKAYLIIRYEEGQYPKDILLTNMKDAEKFENIPLGATGTFKYDPEVRQAGNGKWYQDLKCWSWQIDQASAPSTQEPF